MTLGKPCFLVDSYLITFDLPWDFPKAWLLHCGCVLEHFTFPRSLGQSPLEEGGLGHVWPVGRALGQFLLDLAGDPEQVSL